MGIWIGDQELGLRIGIGYLDCRFEFGIGFGDLGLWIRIFIGDYYWVLELWIWDYDLGFGIRTGDWGFVIVD